MTPAVGQFWRTSATGSLYQVKRIDLSHPDIFQRVELRLVEAGKALRSEWWSEQTQEDRSLHDDRFPLATIEENSKLLMVEPAWFEHGAATFAGVSS